jgi:hypothetical protein
MSETETQAPVPAPAGVPPVAEPGGPVEPDEPTTENGDDDNGDAGEED